MNSSNTAFTLMLILMSSCLYIGKDEARGGGGSGHGGSGDGASDGGGSDDGGSDGGGSDDGGSDDTGDDCESERLYFDEDGDGYGVSDNFVEECVGYPDHVPQAGDCADTDPTRNPGAVEACGDGVDQDCDDVDPDCAWDGALDLADVAGLRLDGEVPDAYIATALADAGDLDGDGDSELVLGSNQPYGYSGRLWVVDGDASLSTAGEVTTAEVDHFTLSGTASAQFGAVAWGVGDLNGDGTDGFAVGLLDWPESAHSALLWFDGPLDASGTIEDAQRVFLLDVTTLSNSNGTEAAGGLGWNDAPVLLFGASYHTGLNPYDGRAWLVEDPSSSTDAMVLDDEATVVFDATDMTEGTPDDRRLGAGVQLCDFSGDGLDEVVLAAGTASGAATDAQSAIYLWYSDAALPSRPTWDDAGVIITGAPLLGMPTLCGDLNGDGALELVFASDQNNYQALVADGTYFSDPTVPPYELASSTLDYWLIPDDGRNNGQLTVVPNPFGDGQDHVVLADPYFDSSTVGRVWVMDGLPPGRAQDVTAGGDSVLATVYDTVGNLSGYQLQGLFDLDGDGYGDLAIGDGGHLPEDDGGRVHVMFGGP